MSLCRKLPEAKNRVFHHFFHHFSPFFTTFHPSRPGGLKPHVPAPERRLRGRCGAELRGSGPGDLSAGCDRTVSWGLMDFNGILMG